MWSEEDQNTAVRLSIQPLRRSRGGFIVHSLGSVKLWEWSERNVHSRQRLHPFLRALRMDVEPVLALLSFQCPMRTRKPESARSTLRPHYLPHLGTFHLSDFSRTSIIKIFTMKSYTFRAYPRWSAVARIANFFSEISSSEHGMQTRTPHPQHTMPAQKSYMRGYRQALPSHNIVRSLRLP
jgi:hypothetical protein